MLFFITLLILLQIFLAYFVFAFNKKGFLYPINTFIIFFTLTYPVGSIFILIIIILNDAYRINYHDILLINLFSLFSITLLLAFYLFFRKIIWNKKRFILDAPVSALKLSIVIFIILGIVGLYLYFYKNGFVLFKEGTYENKNIANRGNGLYRILFNFYLPLATLIATSIYWKHLKVILIFGFSLGLLIYLIYGGGRAPAIMPVLLPILLLYHRKLIKTKKLLNYGLFLFLLIISMTFVRYNSYFEERNVNPALDLLYKLQGSFSPVDSFGTIIKHVPSYLNYQYDAVFNSLLMLIPRAIWDDKPDQIGVASVIYTQKILNYSQDLTISPTLLGELYLYGGIIGIIIGMLLTSILIVWLERVYYASFSSKLAEIFFIYICLTPFSIMREGISVSSTLLILQLILFFISFSVVLTISGKKVKRKAIGYTALK